MIMLDALRSHYERTGDIRVIPLMLKFFRWCASLDEEHFLPKAPKWTDPNYYPDAKMYGFWQTHRAGDMLPPLYWLYNRTGESFLLDLAHRSMRHVNPPGEKWLDNHVVNFTQRFRIYGTYYLQTKDPADLQKTEYYYNSHMAEWGQMPGGGFAADENVREGKTDPRQGFETCGSGEFCKSFYILSEITGQPLYADRSEDILFNTFPATHDREMKGLHYLTASNQIQLDQGSHHDFQNEARQLDYTPFGIYRCCQHNASQTWPGYARRLWMAADGDGLAAWMYGACTADALVRGGVKVHIEEETDYPFETGIRITLQPERPVEFPLYLRIPSWAKSVTLKVAGQEQKVEAAAGPVICIEKEWKPGDTVELDFQAQIEYRTWAKQKGAVSVQYGPLSYSLKIKENWTKYSGSREWPEWIVMPESDWNYGLITGDIKVKKQEKPKAQPWTAETAPIELSAKGRKIPQWQKHDDMADPLPASPVQTQEPVEELTLIPMGCARLRISCFPATN
jgi:hypothetical protein